MLQFQDLLSQYVFAKGSIISSAFPIEETLLVGQLAIRICYLLRLALFGSFQPGTKKISLLQMKRHITHNDVVDIFYITVYISLLVYLV